MFPGPTAGSFVKYTGATTFGGASHTGDRAVADPRLGACGHEAAVQAPAFAGGERRASLLLAAYPAMAAAGGGR